jgi:RNA polymerase sigma factor for flagellar operon FliA
MTFLKEKPTKQQIYATWTGYVQNRDLKTRDTLVENYLPLLRGIARRVHAKLRGHVELDDLTSSGALGLLAAVDTFDPSRGIAFETFCTYRIRGAIIDEVRAMDWVPRLVRGRGRQLAEAEQALSNTPGCRPTDAELADYLGLSSEALRNIRRDDRKAVLVSLSAITACHNEDATSSHELDALSDNGVQDVSRRVMGEEFEEMTTAGLSKAELLVLKLYYFEEMTMAEVGRVLDLSESRVSQMHTSILARLRANPVVKAKKRASSEYSQGPRLAGTAAPTTHARKRLVA